MSAPQSAVQAPMSLAVIGLGFIGLPLSLSYAMHGAKVIGLDALPRLVEDINNGITHHQEYFELRSAQDILREQLEAGRFRASLDYAEAAREVDHYFVTVGVPVQNGDPNYTYLRKACEQLVDVLKSGDTVILRSTVIPGTTEQMVRPILESKGMKAGVDFHLAYCSERIAEGRAFEEFMTMPLAVGGVNERSAELAQKALSFVTKAEITVTEMAIVETAKVLENIQRDVNIAMVQQFARFSEKMGLDTYELIRVANTHKRVNLLIPGPGVGGYCLPNALYYLAPKAKELGVNIDLLETARRVNDEVPGVLVDMVEEALKEQGKPLKGSKVAVLGLAMKDFSNDDRISPPHHVAELLVERGAQVAAYDPAVDSHPAYRVSSLQEAVQDADALLYLAAQEEFLTIEWPALLAAMSKHPVLFDTKNRIPRTVQGQAKLVRI